MSRAELRIANLRAALELIASTGCRCRTSSVVPCRSCVAKQALAADALLEDCEEAEDD